MQGILEDKIQKKKQIQTHLTGNALSWLSMTNNLQHLGIDKEREKIPLSLLFKGLLSDHLSGYYQQ